MSIALSQIPGLNDLPDSTLTSGTVLTDATLVKILENTKFGAVSQEFFYADASPGDVVAEVISPQDGYIYSRAEMFYVGSIRSTPGPFGPQFPGQILVLNTSTFPDGGLQNLTAYYVQDGEQNNSYQDGTLGIWVMAKRNWGGFTFSALPTYTDLGDSAWNQDAAVGQTIIQQLNRNAKLAAVRAETFPYAAVTISSISRASNVVTVTTPVAHQFAVGNPIVVLFCDDPSFNGNFTVASAPSSTTLTFSQVGMDASSSHGRIQHGWYSNGQAVPFPISPVDGRAYTSSETKFLPFWMYTGKSDGSGPSGAGRIRRLQLSVNATTGVVTSTVTYYNGTTQTATNDGRMNVVAFCQRSGVSMAAVASAFTDLDDSAFFFGAPLGDTSIKNVNQNAKFAIVSHEFFLTTQVNGNTVPLPTSPVDGYVYSRSQLYYYYTLTDTGDAGTGDITSFNCSVDQNTGVVTAQVNGAAGPAGHQVTVVTVALRGQPTGAGASADVAASGSGSDTRDPRDPGSRGGAGGHFF